MLRHNAIVFGCGALVGLAISFNSELMIIDLGFGNGVKGFVGEWLFVWLACYVLGRGEQKISLTASSFNWRQPCYLFFSAGLFFLGSACAALLTTPFVCCASRVFLVFLYFSAALILPAYGYVWLSAKISGDGR